MLVLAGCVPPAEENEEDAAQNQATCEVDSSSSLTTGQELVANLTCTVSTIYQGKRLSIAYDESLTSLKLVVLGDKAVGQIEGETVGQSGKLSYILPRKAEFQAKLKLTGVTAGKGQLQFKILRKKSNWAFTVVNGGSNPSPNSGGGSTPSTPKALTLGVAVTATAFTKMQDTSDKAYGRSVMRLDTSQTLVSNDKTVCEDTPLNALLVSSDDFLNCEKVYVQKGNKTNHVIIPKQTWGLNKTYKVAIKTAGGASAFNRSGNPVSFATNNANHNTVAHITGFDVDSFSQVLTDDFHLEKDGELWYYIDKGDRIPRYDSSECQAVDYQNTKSVKFKNLNNDNSGNRALAQAVFGDTQRHYVGRAFTATVTVIWTLNGIRPSGYSINNKIAGINNIYYFCSVTIPERT